MKKKILSLKTEKLNVEKAIKYMSITCFSL